MSIQLRPPSSLTSVHNSKSPIIYTRPSVTFLQGTWHVTHSTLPMWKSNRNVHITYTPLLCSSDPIHDGSLSAAAAADTQLDDMVSYNSLNGDKVKTVHGIDTPVADGGWHWRGKGWLAIASSHWEILGYGSEKPDGPVSLHNNGNQWVVTYFTKSLFTPAGIDIYSRSAGGLRDETINGILEMLKRMEGPEMVKLAGEMFEVKRDHCWLETCKKLTV
ncbi:uncharacterized protein V1513DRAFT_458473 [Lipomyces chichibuensis]|uniref:uncharacterized protein n=1 Tax=Lipomyces chichibuensis TaxID=1546026 RepID=UPI0033432C28